MRLVKFISLLILLFSIVEEKQSQCSNFTVNAGLSADLVTETLYSEDFTGQNGKGIEGTNPKDISGCTWDIDATNAILSDQFDYFKVLNDKLQSRDLDGICSWISPSVNIQDFININLSLKASQISNASRYEASDIFYSEYSIDGGSWTYFSINGQMTDGLSATNVNVSQSGLKGSTVRIRVKIAVNEDNESFSLDDILVTGQSYKKNVCSGANLTLGGLPTATGFIGSPVVSYQWTPSTGLSSPNVSNPTANPTLPTIYKVVASYVDNAVTCKDSSLLYINIADQIVISSSSPVCITDTLTISETGGNAQEWLWTSNLGATILNDDQSSSKVVGMTNGEVFTVVTQDYINNCLNNTASTTIQVNPQPTVVNWTNPIGTLCSDDTPFLLAGGIPLPISPTSAYYSGTGVTNNIYDPSTVGYGNFLLPVELMYIYTDNNGCKDTALNNINVRQSPDAELTTTSSGLINFNINASGDWSYCDISSPPFTLNVELSSVVTAANTAGTSYTIDFGNGDPVMPIFPGFNTTGSYNNPGNYEIKINANDPTFSCTRVYKKNFFYGTNPSIAVSIPANVLDLCAPATISFPVDVTGNSPGTRYRKYTNDGKPDSSFLNNSLIYNVIHTFDRSSCGYSTIQNANAFLLGVQAVNGCGVASSTADPIVISSPPIAKIEQTDSVFCINTPITFKDSSYEGKFVSLLGTDYTCDTSDAIAWEILPNTGFTLSSGSFGDYANLSRTNTLTHGTTDITLSFQEKGSYTLSLMKVSRCGSGDVFDIDFIKFDIDSLPDAEFTMDKDFNCAPLIVTTKNTSKSINDYNAVFEWTYSTIMEGCEGSAPPLIEQIASDSVLSEIYLENFTGQNNQGNIGMNLDTSLVEWYVDINNPYDPSDRFFVSNEKFVAVGSNVNGSVWYSPVIDISQYNNISAGLKASTNNTATSPTREIVTEYKLDGASWTSVTRNPTLTGTNFVDSLVSVQGLNGTSLQLRVTIDLVGIDSIFFDDVFMDGYTDPDSLDARYTFNKPGSYTINLKTTNVCGVDNYKDTVNAGGTPIVTLNAIPDACDTVTIIPSATIDTCFAAMTNYSWIFSGNPPFATQNSTLQEPAPVFFGSLGTFNVDLIATNSCGASTTNPINFTINESPIITLNEIDSVCKNSSLQISSVVNQGTPAYNYSWSSNATINNISISNPIITTNIDEFVYLEVTDLKTCKAYDTIHIDVLDLPVVNAGNPQSVCPEDTAFLAGSVSGALTPYTISWSSPLLSDLTILNPFYDMNGTKTFTLTTTDNFGCIDSSSVTITEFSPPVVNIQPDTNICNSLIDVQLRASPNGGVWSGTSISSLGVYTPEGTGSFTKYYDFSDANTCNTIDSVVLTVNIPPAPNAGVDIQACLDTGVIVLNGVPLGGDWTGTGVTLAGNYNVLTVDTVNLVYSLGTGNCLVKDTMEILIHPLPTINLDVSYQTCISSPDTNIQFSPLGGSWLGNGISPVTGLFSPSSAGIGSHKLIYTYQNPVNGCQNSDSLEITVNSLPTINYDLDTIICLNVNDTINNTSTLAQTHSWTISNGMFSNLKDPVFNINAVGFYNLKYIATSTVGCQDSLQSNFEVLAPPIASYSCPDSGCGPLLVNFTNNSTGKYISYLWDFGLDNSLGNDSTSIDTLPPNHIYNEGVISDTSYFSSLTVTNLCGISIQNTEIKSMPKPVSFFGPTSNVGDCLSGNITLANNSYGLPDTYSWDFGDGSFGNTSDTLFDHFYPPVTSTSFYTIKLRVTNECGADSSSEVISIIPNTLVAAFSTDTTVGCTPLDVKFTQFTVVGSNTQSWDFGDGNFTNTFSPTHTFTDTGSFQVSLAVSDACNFDTAYTTIIVNTSPIVSFSVIDDTLCAGSTFQFNNSSDVGISNNWNFGDGSPTSTLTDPNHIFTDSGSFRVILLGTSLTNNCPAYDSVDLVVLPYPEITATSDTSNGCIPLPVNFSSTVNSVGYYLWDFGDGNTSILANPTHNYTTDGYYIVNVRFEDLSGCVDSFDFNMTPHPVPVANFDPIQLDTCILPINYNFQNITNGGVSYQWDFGDGTSSPITNPTDSLNPKSYTNAGNYDIKLLTNNSFGCADSITKSIFIKPIPNSDFDVLQLDSCILPASYSLVNNSTGAVLNSWNLGNGATTNNPNFNSYSYNNSGSYDISLVVMNSYGCLDTSINTVNILPIPQVDFSYFKQDTCVLPSNYLFTNLSSGGDFFTWTFDSLGNDIQKDSTSFIFNNNGTYQVSIVGENISGCKDSTAKVVTVNSKPVAIFTLDTTIGCEPFSAIFTNNSQNSNYYNWDFNDGSTGSFLNGTHLFQNFGNYSIKLVVEDVNGCKDSISTTININPTPISNYTFTSTDPCYLPIDVVFTNTSTGGNNYQWDFGNGQVANIQNPDTITFDSIGVFNLQLVVSNSFNCFDTTNNSFDVIYNQVPVAQLNFKDSICLRDTSFLFSTSLFTDSLIWDLGNGINFSGDSVLFISDTSGQFSINLFAYNTTSGCSDTLLGNNNLIILPSPTAEFTFNHVKGFEPLSGSIEFFNNSLGASSYLWDFGYGDSSILETPTYYYKYNFDGTYYYTLYTTNPDKCTDSLTKDLYIEFKKALYIPNAISPEATNSQVSRFIPKGTGMNFYKIEIFDLFGNVIWESTALNDEGQPTESWDGKYNGVGVEPDVYIWKVEAQFKDESFWGGQKPIEENILRKTGTLTVIR